MDVELEENFAVGMHFASDCYGIMGSGFVKYTADEESCNVWTADSDMCKRFAFQLIAEPDTEPLQLRTAAHE